jgi:hypothetical protein
MAESTSTRCDGITGTGKQCSRKPSPGSAYCKQHVDNPVNVDYDELLGRAVDWISIALGAASTPKWSPTLAEFRAMTREEHRAWQQSPPKWTPSANSEALLDEMHRALVARQERGGRQ